MTTDGQIIELQRDLNVLLEMESYQDMTDAEIQSIIDYKVGIARRDGYQDAVHDSLLVSQQQIFAAHTARVEASAAVLQSMLEIQIPWVTVGGDY